ncbi:MAG TPA: cytochrome c [Candidatus Binataceae bacterium]|nr:cytochrome c [Candidatus Binataceae bacterium]
MVLVGAASLAHAGARDGPASAPEHFRVARAIFEKNCASCHGARGEGAPHWEHRDAKGELPPPPLDAGGHAWKHADGMLYRLVEAGWRDPFNKTERLTMPAFGGKLSPQQIRAIIGYLKTLWTPAQRRFQLGESRREPFPPDARPSGRQGKSGGMQPRN